MNFLAHLWLADRTGTSLAGSVLGDVVRGGDLSAYPPPLALGVRLHRRIDAVTERHPLIAAARQGFAAGSRRYAGIVLDLVCDHLLARDWPAHHEQAFAAFCRQAGADIAAAAPWFLQAGGRRSDARGFSELLMSYRHEAGIDRALQRVALRLRQPQPLLAAAQGWQVHGARLAPLLGPLLADLQAAAMRAIGDTPAA